MLWPYWMVWVNLDAKKLGQVLADKHPYVRRLAFRLAEKFPDKGDYFAQFFDFESAREI